MTRVQLPVGCLVRIEKSDLQGVIDQLKTMGYRVVGPTVSQAAITYGDLEHIDQLPVGYVDEQEAGKYRLVKNGRGYFFDFVVGPHSLKNFLFPPRTTILETIRVKGSLQMKVPTPSEKPLAVIGARACDLKAMEIQDRVFVEGPYLDTDYQARRENLFVLAVNCGRAAATCFCTSMHSGPAVSGGADLSLFELAEHFVIEVCTERGGEAIATVPWRPCSIKEVNDAQEVPKVAEAQIRRRLDTREIKELLLDNLEHEQWDKVASRCLACSNCTMVCPTCFCSSVQDVCDLSGEVARRERQWDSCFTDDHSYMNSGTIRKTTRSRYRQWLTHKLGSWIDQFGTSGCVGCGRCITWCPVGIDLTQEVAALRGEST